MMTTMPIKTLITALLVGLLALFGLLGFSYTLFINAMIAYVSTTLILVATFISYARAVKMRVEMSEGGIIDDQDAVAKIYDPYGLYDEKGDEAADIKVIKQEFKRSKRSLFEVLRDSKPALSLYRLMAYGFLALGFFYLHHNRFFDLASYLIALSLPLIIVVGVLFVHLKKGEKI